ncbi:DUF4209 domain-containing protein [Hymenobacter persicinus]|nr:DUF4209 domain-containing protein [Hymenobacter persicinus]
MQDLQSYLRYLDTASEDVRDTHALTARLGELAVQLAEAGDADGARWARVEQEVLAASKQLDRGVGYQISGTRKDEQGVEHEVGWPDTSGYAEPEYAYVRRRYQETPNLYLKSEYGLFLYLRKHLRTNEQVRELAATLFQLGVGYVEKHRVGGERTHYALHALEALRKAFQLANTRKNDASVAQLLGEIVQYLVALHTTWPLDNRATLRVLSAITELFTEYYRALTAPEQADALLEQDWRGVQQLAQTYRHGAIELAAEASELAGKAGRERARWSFFQAQQLEALAQEAEVQHNMTAVAFTERALRIYRQLKDEENSRRLELEYQRLRTRFALTQTRTQMPDEATRALMEYIAEVVRSKDAQGIIAELCLTPMFHSLDRVSEAAQAQRDSFMDMLPKSLEDKHGNTVQTFYTEEEKEQFQFLNTYSLLAQLSTQTLVKLMLEAFKARKLTADAVQEFLQRSWLGQPRLVESSGQQTQTQPLRLVMSGVRLLFHELEAWRQDPDYEPDFIASTDSLTLKVEYLLRYICVQLRLPTFKMRENTDVTMEKLLDELLADLKGKLEEDDRFFIKFFLSEKAGYNLRNRVAHGLMDDDEYGVENVFLVLTMILKLASYEFRAV